MGKKKQAKEKEVKQKIIIETYSTETEEDNEELKTKPKRNHRDLEKENEIFQQFKQQFLNNMGLVRLTF